MPNKYVGAFKFLTKGARKGKVAPTITQPRQLKKTMKDIRSKYERFGFKQAKTAKERANIVRTKKSIERMDKLDELQSKRKEGVKAKKEIKRMIDTNQADKVGGKVFHRSVEEKKAMGGSVTGKQLNSKLKGAIDTLKKKKESAPKKDSIKDKILNPKKKKRLEELKKELGMKKGGRAKKFPDLTGDGKVTQADILKGRGVFKKGGGVKQMVKTVTSPITRLRNKLKSKKFGRGKK